MKLKTTLFAAAATLAIAPAAHAYQGLYGAIGAGLTYQQPDQDGEFFGAIPGADTEIDYDNGIGVYTAIGYAFGNNWRSELEYSYRDNDVRHITGDGAGFAGFEDLNGGIEAHALMVNLIRDFDTGNNVTPYLGAGFGAASLNAEYSGTNGAQSIAIDSNNKALAYQAIAGLGIALADNLSLDLSYRYFATTGQDFEGTIAGFPGALQQDYDTHNLFAGLRWNFGAVAPAPVAVQYKDCWDGSSVPVSADCPPELVETPSADLDPIQVTVYFDYDKSNLTPEASNLVREASARALANDIDGVVVQGNTDTSGGSAYNQALSQRRANVVRDALIANGVPADIIRTESNGENNLAKATPDGTREPLNRRTDVTISFE